MEVLLCCSSDLSGAKDEGLVLALLGNSTGLSTLVKLTI
jgi:hypothetical protein